MGIFDRLKNESGHPANANIAVIATERPENEGITAKTAIIATATPPKEEMEIPYSDPVSTLEPEPLPDHVDRESVLFGKLTGGPVLEMSETTFTLIHPLTGERVTLSKEWLVTMDERSAILEYEARLAREEADRKARGMLFNQFREGGKP
ncbi:MAG: hypothetical protein ACYCR5_10690 [Leptospirillum sp.]